MHREINATTPESIRELDRAVDEVLTRALDVYGEYYDTEGW